MFDLFTDSQGRLWIGTQDGVGYLIPPDIEVSFTRDDVGEGISWVKGCTEDNQGRILARMRGAGMTLMVFDGEWETRRLAGRSSANSLPQNLVVDSQDRLWAGTSGSGLQHSSIEGETVFYKPANSGMQHYVPQMLLIDSRGFLWVGSRDANSKIIESPGVHLEGQDGLSLVDLGEELPEPVPSSLIQLRRQLTAPIRWTHNTLSFGWRVASDDPLVFSIPIVLLGASVASLLVATARLIVLPDRRSLIWLSGSAGCIVVLLVILGAITYMYLIFSMT